MKRFLKRLLGATRKHIIPSIGVLALVIFSGLILFEATKATVDITQNGEKETVKTHSNTVGELLDELEVVVGAYDDLSHDKDVKLETGMEIKYKEAERIIVTIDEVEEVFYTTADNVEEFLVAEGLAFSDRDDVSYGLEDVIEADSHLVINQAYEVTIDNGGKKEKVWSTVGTVEELLQAHNITLNKEDKIKPAIDKEHHADTVVEITRVTKTTDTIQERLTFQVEEKQDETLAKGKTKVIEEGQEGVVVKKYEITEENGEEVNRDLIEEKVEKEKKNRVVAIGTKVEQPKAQLVTLSKEEKKPTSNNTSQSSTEAPSGKEMVVNATAYSADCKGCSGITATGINLKDNRNKKVIAVDPSVIPLGSKVWVEGYGTAIAGDTGGAIKGNRIDIHVPSHAEAANFGWKKVKIKVLD